MNRTTKHSRRGFTLLEVLATLILIGIILPAVMGGISLATAAAGEAKHKVEAVSLAQTKLSELLATTQYQPTSSSGDFADYPGYAWTASIETRDTNLSQVSVRVTWFAHGQERFVDLSSMIYTAYSTDSTGTGTSATGTGTSTR
ncbi:MAG TPA: type II secretion system protein [Tepidisphaeraceae bacterium]|nr:type II secretion system protein [Tepidisphaeraceae bacterium]